MKEPSVAWQEAEEYYDAVVIESFAFLLPAFFRRLRDGKFRRQVLRQCAVIHLPQATDAQVREAVAVLKKLLLDPVRLMAGATGGEGDEEESSESTDPFWHVRERLHFAIRRRPAPPPLSSSSGSSV